MARRRGSREMRAEEAEESRMLERGHAEELEELRAENKQLRVALAALNAATHTHPCPTCHQARPCTGTGCADGPRECSTCSNCRGW